MNDNGAVGGEDAPGNKKVRDEVFLDIVRENKTVSTSEAHEHILQRTDWDADRTAVYRRLTDLAEQGEIVRYRPGNDIEWLSEESFEFNVSDEKFIRAIESEDGAADLEQIADQLGCSEWAVLERLQDLVNEDKIVSKRIGDDTTIWLTK
jgi:DNA-binding Lrp family transcriptional regulator